MDVNLTKSEIDLMLWEVDENLDGTVDWKEFLNMYKKCISDKTGLEPKSLFHMVQFLMYCNHSDEESETEKDKDKYKIKEEREKFKITVEDTLELLYVRHGRHNLDTEIHHIFGDEEKTPNGEEK